MTTSFRDLFIDFLNENIDETSEFIQEMYYDNCGEYNSDNGFIGEINSIFHDYYNDFIQCESENLVDNFEYFINQDYFEGNTLKEVIAEFLENEYSWFNTEDTYDIIANNSGYDDIVIADLKKERKRG